MKFKNIIVGLTLSAALTCTGVSFADTLQINANDSLKDDILVTCTSAPPAKDGFIGQQLPWTLVRLRFFPTATEATCKFYHGEDLLGQGDVTVNLTTDTGVIDNIVTEPGHSIDGPTVTGGNTVVDIIS